MGDSPHPCPLPEGRGSLALFERKGKAELSPSVQKAHHLPPCYNSPMLTPEVVGELQAIFILRDFTADDLDDIARGMDLETFVPGQEIYRQGRPANAIYLILSGRVELHTRVKDTDPIHVGSLSAGDVLGEYELVTNQSRQSTATAAEPTRAVRWDRKSLGAASKARPALLERLRFGAEGYRLRSRLKLNWLGEEEQLRGLARKHVVLMYDAMILPGLLLLGAIGLTWWALNGGAGIAGPAAGLFGLLGAGAAIWQRIDWGNDYYIVTDRRVVRLEKIVGLYDNRQEAPLRMILSVSTSSSMLGRMYGFGDVVIRSYTGQITFPNVTSPREMAALIEEQIRRLLRRQRQLEQETIAEALRQRLESGPAEAAPGPSMPAPPPIDPNESRVGMDRWSFQVRFEDQGVITYRKHWAVLIRAIALPSLVLLATAAILGAELGGLLAGLPADVVLTIAAVLLLGVGLWWLYQYLDWANDLYQITPTHIIDIYKKPLGREVRKVAPLDNILGTSIDRKGIIGVLLNYGDVTAEVGTAQFDFEGVFDPVGAQQDIARAIDRLLERRSDTERQRRQDEMVEWLTAYHDQVASPPQGGRPTEKRNHEYP
jgi:CRP-like cAMP-binding protein